MLEIVGSDVTANGHLEGIPLSPIDKAPRRGGIQSRPDQLSRETGPGLLCLNLVVASDKWRMHTIFRSSHFAGSFINL